MRQPSLAAQLLRQARTAADAKASERPALSSASVAGVIRSSRSARMIRHGYQTASRIRRVGPNQR
jgi:hypothetical protein